MSKRNKSNSLNKSIYMKERRRIQRFISRAEKRGYSFPENILPKIPKKVTKQSIGRLQKLTPNVLYSKAQYGGEATFGEVVLGLQGLQAERKIRAKKSALTRKVNKESEGLFYSTDRINIDTFFYDRQIISSWRESIKRFAKSGVKDILIDALGMWESKYGMHKVASVLQKAAEQGILVTYDVAYEGAKARQYVANVNSLFPDSGIDMLKYADALEAEEDWDKYDV